MKRKTLLLSAALFGAAAALAPAAAEAGLDLGIGTVLGRSGIHTGVNYRIGRWRPPFGAHIYLDASRYVNGDPNRRHRLPVEEVRNRGGENVDLRVSPKESWVYLNGVRIDAQGRGKISLPPGKHRLEFVAQGRRSEMAELDVQPGVVYRVERKLQKLQRGEQGDMRAMWPIPPVSVAEALKAGEPASANGRPAEAPRLDKPSAAKPDAEAAAAGEEERR
jgi:hypothetical protein